MKKQVVYIHGGEVHETYDAFLEDLHSYTIDPYTEKKRWRMSLQQRLGESYEVFIPEMPNKLDAKYLEWEIWFEKYIPYMQNDAILIGHSLGGVFLARFLSERKLSILIKTLFLISAPYWSSKTESKKWGGFVFGEQKISLLQTACMNIVLIHSKDDPIVPFEDLERYSAALPKATLRAFENRGHFTQAEFPELIEEIRKIGV